MKHGAGEPVGHRQMHDVGRMRASGQHEPAVERRRHVVGMRRAAAGLLPRHRAGEEDVERGGTAEQLVDGDHGGDGAGAAAADAAFERQAFV